MDREKLTTIIEHYGVENQILKTCEELTELQAELLKGHNKHNSFAKFRVDDIQNEMADVLIMLEQLKIIFNIDDFSIDYGISYKINRQLKRIENEL